MNKLVGEYFKRVVTLQIPVQLQFVKTGDGLATDTTIICVKLEIAERAE